MTKHLIIIIYLCVVKVIVEEVWREVLFVPTVIEGYFMLTLCKTLKQVYSRYCIHYCIYVPQN